MQAGKSKGKEVTVARPSVSPKSRSRKRRLERIFDFLPYLSSSVFYVSFIARSAFRVGKILYFSLFDDAMIAMIYGRNVAQGRGLVWNLSDRVEGYTNFLWTLWMGALHLLPVHESKISLMVMITGAAILLINVFVVGKISTALGGSRAVRLSAMWLTGLYYPLVYWTLRGMEVGLVTLGISIMTLLTIRWWNGQDSGLGKLGVAMSLMVLVRTELVIVCGLFILFIALTSSKDQLRHWVIALALPVFLTVAAHTLFRLVYYGDPLPNTYYLKIQGVSLQERLNRGFPGLNVTLFLHLYAPLAFAVAFIVARRQAVGRAALLLASTAAILMAYSAYVGGDAWEWMLYANRYITPAGPPLFILGAMGVDQILGRKSSLQQRAGVVAAAMLVATVLFSFVSREQLRLVGIGGKLITDLGPRIGVVTLIILLMAILRGGSSEKLASAPKGILGNRGMFALVFIVFWATNGISLQNWAVQNAVHIEDYDKPASRYGLALRGATDPKATLLVGGAGAIPYFSHRISLDILGKCDKVIARMHPVWDFNPGHNKWNYDYSIRQMNPDLVAQLHSPTKKDFELIKAWGYERFGEKVFVRKDSKLINRTLVRRALASIQRIPAV